MRVLFAGGGSGGHVVPNIILIEELQKKFLNKKTVEILYIGRRKGLEKGLIEALKIDYKGIFCGKIRRYFSLRNVVDILKIPVGIFQSVLIVSKFKPNVVFCKGGYVSFPVAFAGWLLKVPVVIHESDPSPGLANKIAARFADQICVSSEEAKRNFPNHQTILTGNPVRSDIDQGEVQKGRDFTKLLENIPVLLIMGGGLGDDYINNLVWKNLNAFIGSYQIIHLCGHSHLKSETQIASLLSSENQKYLARYKAYEFIKDELKDLYALSDIVITRAGALTLAELELLQKPAILIPISKKCSRGEQFENAKIFLEKNEAQILNEDAFDMDTLLHHLSNLLKSPQKSIRKIPQESASMKIIQVLEKYNF